MKRFGNIAVLATIALAAGGVAWLALGGGAGAPAPRDGRAGARAPAVAAGGREGGARQAEAGATARVAGAKTDGARADARDGGGGRGDAEEDGRGRGQIRSGVPGEPRDLTEGEILAQIRAGTPGFEVLASRLPLERARVEPRLQAGDEWVVETFYRQMQAPREVWSNPAPWRFRVEGEVEFRGEACWQIVVTRADDPGVEPAVFYVTRATYRLAGAHATVVQQGKKVSVTYIPGEMALDQGVKVAFSAIPLDLPPLGAEAHVLPAGLRPEAPGEGRDRARMPAPEDLVGAGGAYLEVTYAHPVDGTPIRQRWSRDDMRWPVESRTNTTWSFRLRD